MLITDNRTETTRGGEHGVSADRERLRVTFDLTAGRYHQARPRYPAALFDELTALAGLRPGDRLLEVHRSPGARHGRAVDATASTSATADRLARECQRPACNQRRISQPVVRP